MNSILIIDDDKELCALLQKGIKTENMEADVVYSGYDGLSALARKDYLLIVLDVMMPGIDGFETLTKIRESSGIPILMAKRCTKQFVRE